MMPMRHTITVGLLCVCLMMAAGCKKGAEPPEQPESVRQSISLEQLAPTPADGSAVPPDGAEAVAPDIVVATPGEPATVMSGSSGADTGPPAASPPETEETVSAQGVPTPETAAPPEAQPPVTPSEIVAETEEILEEEAAIPESDIEASIDLEASGEGDEDASLDESALLPEPEIVINLMEEMEPPADGTSAGAPMGEDETANLFSPFTPLFQKDSKEEDLLMDSADPQRKRAFLTPLERISLGQLTLSGIIRASSGNRAIVIDATGKGYVIKKGTYLGLNSGQVEEIVDDRVLVVEMIGGRRAVTELKLQKPAGE